MRRYQKNMNYYELQDMARGWLWIDFMHLVGRLGRLRINGCLEFKVGL